MNSPIKASMKTPTRTPLRAIRAVSLLLMCLAPVLLAQAASAAESPAPGTARYQPETEQAFQQQLAGGQIRTATINKRRRSVRLIMKDGRRLLVKYPAKQEPRVYRQLKANGVHVFVLGKSQALKEVPKKAVHHKLRYIVGGVLLAVIVVVGTVLLVKRRRTPV
jgi:hypothetical protein